MTSQSDAAERRERFRLVYEENYAPILGYALRRTRADEAQDVVAETFLVAWRRLDDVPAHEARLWLYGTARRVLPNRARAERRRGRLASRLREHSVDVHVDVHAGGAVAAAFARLRPDERELLSLVAWEGLKTEEIA